MSLPPHRYSHPQRPRLLLASIPLQRNPSLLWKCTQETENWFLIHMHTSPPMLVPPGGSGLLALWASGSAEMISHTPHSLHTCHCVGEHDMPATTIRTQSSYTRVPAEPLWWSMEYSTNLRTGPLDSHPVKDVKVSIQEDQVYSPLHTVSGIPTSNTCLYSYPQN